jgi:hypothetical protein
MARCDPRAREVEERAIVIARLEVRLGREALEIVQHVARIGRRRPRCTHLCERLARERVDSFVPTADPAPSSARICAEGMLGHGFRERVAREHGPMLEASRSQRRDERATDRARAERRDDPSDRAHDVVVQDFARQG